MSKVAKSTIINRFFERREAISATRTTSGFTIVELLIVIVVIAILAAISIVAYNGIQQRAQNTKTLQAVSQYVKAVYSYSALNSKYPADPSWPCLGPLGTTCALASGPANCSVSSDGGSSTTASFDTMMRQIMGDTLPELSSQTVSCNGSTYKGGYYRSTDGVNATIQFYLKGNQACTGIGGISNAGKTQLEETTRCTLYFPVPS